MFLNLLLILFSGLPFADAASCQIDCGEAGTASISCTHGCSCDCAVSKDKKGPRCSCEKE